jgi:hypothetical protein
MPMPSAQNEEHLTSLLKQVFRVVYIDLSEHATGLLRFVL